MSQQRVTTSSGIPLSSIAPFDTKRARKELLKGNIPTKWSPPVALSIQPPNPPKPSKGRNARRRAYKRAKKAQVS